MKITPRGSDYLKAAVATALISSILDIRITLALSLGLVISALISQLLLATASERKIKIEFEKMELTGFKQDEIIGTVRILSGRRRFVSVHVSKVEGPSGVDVRFDNEETSATDATVSVVLGFRPRYAGRFRGFSVTFELQDPLGLFRKNIVIVKAEFTINSLPISLLSHVHSSRPLSISLGERTGKTHGAGQEFYSIDEYRSSIEKRNIFWKKVARMPDHRLMVKIRESNIPKTLRIGLFELPCHSKDRIKWIDTVCEGLGIIGKTILANGCDVEILHNGAGEVVLSHASGIEELSIAIMEAISSRSIEDTEEVSLLLAYSDICITGMKELEDDTLSIAFLRKPTLVIEEPNSSPKRIGDLALVFSGTEDVSHLVNSVVGR